MSRRALAACFVAALLLALPGSLPLRLALRMFDLAGHGMGAADARGTIWSGTLPDAHWRGHRLGDLHVGLRPWRLLAGERRVRLDDGRMHLEIVSGRRVGIEGASGRLETPAPGEWPGLALQWTLDEAGVMFADGRCQAAGGQVSLQLSSGLLPQPVTLSGVPACRDRSLVLELAPAQAGAGPQAPWPLYATLHLDPDGRYEVQVTVRSHDAGVVAALATAGFQSGPAGPGRVLTGTIAR